MGTCNRFFESIVRPDGILFILSCNLLKHRLAKFAGLRVLMALIECSRLMLPPLACRAVLVFWCRVIDAAVAA